MGFLESWYEDNISGKDGEYKGRGFGAAILKPFVDEEKIEGKVQGNKNKATATSLGYHLSDLDVGPGSTTLDVQGAAVRQGKIDKNKEKEGDRTYEKSVLETSLKPQMAGIEAGLEQGRLQHQATMQGMENTNNLAIAGLTQSNNQFMTQMADSKDQRAMELQMRREDMDRLDRRDEKNRRRESIQALVAGLSSLGAAFAV